MEFLLTCKARFSLALIFVNYRRLDTQSISQRIANKLKAEFGESQVFIDVDDMQAGVWSEQLKQQIQSCRVFLAIVGNKWLRLQNEESGQRKLDEESDAVRNEIEYAIKQQKLIIVVFVGEGTLPSKSVLPLSIQALLDFQAVKVRDDETRTFDSDMTSLIEKIKKSAAENTSSHEDILYQLGQVFLSSRADLERYNIARRTLLSYIRDNRQINGDAMRLIQAHVALTISYYLKRLKGDWKSSLGDQVRRVAVDNTLDITDPYDRDKIADFIYKSLALDTDKLLREALENGLSYALPMDKVPMHLLRFGINIAYSSSVTVINSLKVIDQELSHAIKDVSEERIAEALELIEDKLRKQWFLK